MIGGIPFHIAGGAAIVPAAYISGRLLNIPSDMVSAVQAAAASAASGQSFTSSDVIDALNADCGVWILSQGFGKTASDGSGSYAANGDPIGWVGCLNNAGSAINQTTTSLKPTQSALGVTLDGVDDFLSNSRAFSCKTIIAMASAPSWSTFPVYAGLVTGTGTSTGENFAVGESGNTTWFSGHTERATLINGVSTYTYLPATSLKVVSGSYTTRAMSGLVVGRHDGFAGRNWKGTISFVLCSSANYLADSRELMVRRFCNAFFV